MLLRQTILNNQQLTEYIGVCVLAARAAGRNGVHAAGLEESQRRAGTMDAAQRAAAAQESTHRPMGGLLDMPAAGRAHFHRCAASSLSLHDARVISSAAVACAGQLSQTTSRIFFDDRALCAGGAPGRRRRGHPVTIASAQIVTPVDNSPVRLFLTEPCL